MKPEIRTAGRLVMISSLRGPGGYCLFELPEPVFVNEGDRYWLEGANLIVERRNGDHDVFPGMRCR